MKAGWYGKAKRTTQRWMRCCRLSKHFSHKGCRNTMRDAMRRDTPMDTPKYYEFMNPTLQALRAGGGTLTNNEIVDAVARIMSLPDDVMERQHAGHQNMRECEYRIAWAKSYLKQAGYLTQSTRGVWVL